MRTRILITQALIVSVFFTGIANAEKTENKIVSYSPSVETSYPVNVYWGDTHLHTNVSPDGYGLGNSIGRRDAYRFARGERVMAPNGMEARLKRPLDFLVVADHAVNMGIIQRAHAGDKRLTMTEAGKYWYDLVNDDPRYKDWEFYTTKAFTQSPLYMAMMRIFHPNDMTGIESEEPIVVVEDKQIRQSIWGEATTDADHFNQPGLFTALIGYEWTPSQIEGKGQGYGNFHRVVIFKDSAEKANKILPFSRFDSQDPEDLWNFMAGYEAQSGGEVIAIPHNGNATRGAMFALTDLNDQPLSPEYAMTRSRFEPLLEVTQIKGDSETHPVLSSNDEFADFETLNGWYEDDYQETLTKTQTERKRFEYARSALKLGLGQQAKLGVNPFKFGMIGSTDSHNSLSAVSESDFWGGFGTEFPNSGRLMEYSNRSAAGYAAVWAEENTREALFAAMKRKETYATTGPRMTVRFFGGWDYQPDDAFRSNLAKIGYEKGVPMGGDLTHAPADKAPSFLIRATRDPDGANLDRVQVIKGWHDNKGQLHEKIYNIALSDKRKPNWRGKVKPVGNTVDIADASYTNTIGDPELAVVWQDPDFDKDELAFYYVRVLEIPTPRWTAYDAKFFGLKDIPEDVPMIIQERAYTSPIWYSPSGS